MAAQMGKQGPGAQPDPAKMTGGFIILAVVTQVIQLAARFMMLGGSVMCLPSPRANGARTLAVVTLILAGVMTASWLLGEVVNVIANGAAGLAGGAGNPFGGMAGGPPGGAAVVAIVVLGLLQLVAFVGSHFTFGFYVRSLGLCLRDYSLAGSAKGWLLTLGITCVLAVIATVAVLAIVGAAAFQLAQGGGGMGQGGNAGGGPGAAMGGGVMAALGLFCLILVMWLVLLVWYIILLVQTRNAISYRAGRR
jgi:hypothetical protein